MSFNKNKTTSKLIERCVVVSPRHDFIRPWIRAYFANGNTIPLVIVPGPPGDWKDGDMEYCKAAAEFSGGMVFDCSEEWKNSARLSERATLPNRIGWYSKKNILYAVATRLAPKAWAWIDDDAEITGNLDECFDVADRSPGFILVQFYNPSSIDVMHPERFYRSNIDPDDKFCWNSMVFFHGEANIRISEELNKDFPIEEDEIVFCHLYKNNPLWHEGFCDFSIRRWQANCKTIDSIPRNWHGKLLHYTSWRNKGEVKKMWKAKSDRLPKAPFETSENMNAKEDILKGDGPVDAVFVIGTGSIDNNEELRYALRNLEKNCGFIRDVYICGFCPEWVDKTKVKHLQWPDRFSHAKDANIIDKLRHACEQPGIAKRILFCSDDQFQTRKCTWDDFIPRYLRVYQSKDRWYEARNRVWHSRLRDTLERDVQRRKSIGMDIKSVYYYQPHIWMPIDRDRFIDYARWCGYERRDDTIIASGYFNFINAAGKPDFDHTFIGGNAGADTPKTTHVAYHDGSYKTAMIIMKRLFPEPSRFEIVKKREQARSTTAHPSIASDDPFPATSDEMSKILRMMANIRDVPEWNGLMGEVLRAEELRLFGVRGWRTVWIDIMSRWGEATDNGTNRVPVEEPRSEAASKVVEAYIANPDSMRTVRFGITPARKSQEAAPEIVQRRPALASKTEMDSLRAKVRMSLHGRT